VCLDRDLKTDGRISFHPNINTATLVITFADFERFLASRQNPIQYVTI
jgi:Ala-tRNA(Pro) deacylase